ncbi:DUF3077 domain-containing protein [Pseudomonas chlororaphis]|uniref:DUF3077 domain-containing protein n=1 Tax=Pseudomonas chlororaphis TaxID=587753 RepID=UPI0031F59BB8
MNGANLHARYSISTLSASMASLLLHLAKQLTLDAAMEPQADRYAWAAHYLGEMGKAVMDDVHTAMTAGADRH